MHCNNYKASLELNLVNYFLVLATHYLYLEIKKLQLEQKTQPISESFQSSLFFFLFSHWIWKVAHDLCPDMQSLYEPEGASLRLHGHSSLQQSLQWNRAPAKREVSGYIGHSNCKMFCEDAHPFWNYKLNERPHFNFLFLSVLVQYTWLHTKIF